MYTIPKMILGTLSLVLVIFFSSCSWQKQEITDVPPLIMFQNCIYKNDPSPNETTSFYEGNLIKWGTIMTATENNELPTQNFQSSDKTLIGCTIITSKEFPNHIFILSEDKDGFRHYSPYEKLSN